MGLNIQKKNKFVDDIKKLIADDPDLAEGEDHEIIYEIDGINVYGGFYDGTRSVDHNVLKFPDVEWEDILNWGVVVAPETSTYISNNVIKKYEEMGYSNLPIENNHINAQEKELEKQAMNLYIYAGFDVPKKLNSVHDLVIDSNYLGDLTDEFNEEFEVEVEQSTLAELQENQFFSGYGVWVNPTKEQLQDFNASVMLDENEYLQDFKGYEKLYKDRYNEVVKIIEDDSLQR